MAVDEQGDEGSHVGTGRALRLVALLLGPLLGLGPLLIANPVALTPEAWRLTGLMAWMVVWWLSEAVPVPVTALLPIPLLPLLGIVSQAETTAHYGHPLIFLFLGGFLIAGALRRWGLHQRLALTVMRFVGPRPRRIVGGIMLVTAILSMWISNTAAAIMMYAVALSLVEALGTSLPDPTLRRRFGVSLMLGVAYGATIGGLGTLVGSPPNLLLAGFLADTYGIVLDFQRWLRIGMPLVVLLLPLTWVWLTYLAFPLGGVDLEGARDVVRRQFDGLGPLGSAERTVLIVFALTAFGWVFRPQLAAIAGIDISDTTVAIVGAVLLFVLPASVEAGTFLLDWRVAQDVAWDVLLLFGGGLALAAAFEATGLATALGGAVAGLRGMRPWLLILILTATVLLAGELASNTASAATFLPIAGAVASGIDVAPLLLAVPVALAASANFAMPVATPPNAIVFAYEDLTIRDMIRAGIVVDLMAIGLIMLLTWILAEGGFLS